MTRPENQEVNRQVREIRRYLVKAGWRVRTIRPVHTVSRYLLANKQFRYFKIRVSDHKPADRHATRAMLLVHPGAMTVSQCLEAIEAPEGKK